MTTLDRSRTIALMLESDGPGGAEVLLLQLAEELRRRGHDVVPVGPERGVGWLPERLCESGFEPAYFHLDRTLDPGLVRRLAELFRRRGVELVHGHEFTMAVYGAAAARRAGLPNVITFHGSQTMCRALRRRVAVRWAMRRSAATVAVSEATRLQLAADLGVPAGHIVTVAKGVPGRTGDPAPIRAELGVRDGERLLLAVGNLSERKGHLVLLQALAQLEREGLRTPWRLAIAGGRGGEMHEALVRFAGEHGLASRVHILLNRTDIPNLQAAADVFVMPSLWEGLPLAVLEAMVAGKAIVASRTSGIPEAIVDGEHGLLVPPGDPAALAAALRQVLEHGDLRQRLANAAERRGRAEFTIEAMADRYEAVYRRALARA
jgi:glycosyltransferase involved in cell wall biosynthesis